MNKRRRLLRKGGRADHHYQLANAYGLPARFALLEFYVAAPRIADRLVIVRLRASTLQQTNRTWCAKSRRHGQGALKKYLTYRPKDDEPSIARDAAGLVNT